MAIELSSDEVLRLLNALGYTIYSTCYKGNIVFTATLKRYVVDYDRAVLGKNIETQFLTDCFDNVFELFEYIIKLKQM